MSFCNWREFRCSVEGLATSFRLTSQVTSLILHFYHFIRRLKLKEYFHFNPPHNNQDNPENHVTTDDEMPNLNWSNKNSDWYPDSVKNDRSEGLLKFINNVTKDLKTI